MKLQKQGTRKLDLSIINVKENVRKNYDPDYIERLAKSIKRHGLKQPVSVIENEDGTYDLLVGYCRYKAHELLVSQGESFNQIMCIIHPECDRIIIQLIENIVRKDLTAEELEDSIYSLIQSGMSQKEIAETLSIRITRVSDILAAKKTRDSMKEKKIDTTGMSTSAVSLLRSVPEKKQKEVIKKVKEKGGTVKATKEVIEDLKPTISKENYEQRLKRAKRKPPELTPEEVEELIDISNKAYEEAEKRNPHYCTKSELCENQAGCKICSYNIKNQKPKGEQEEKAFISITIKEFLHLPEVKAIIDREKYIVQGKCEYCGKEF